MVDGDPTVIERFIARQEFGILFGGYFIASDAESSKSDRYIGVWGKDKVRRFKQILKLRGCDFVVLKIDGASRSFRQLSQEWT
jgi:hypothetical protein